MPSVPHPRFASLFQRFIPRLFALGALLTPLTTAACDLDVRVHADVPLDDSHTLHVTYRNRAPSSGRSISHP